METHPNDPIYPIVEDARISDWDDRLAAQAIFSGLSKREWLAGLAMQGYISNDPDAANENPKILATAKWAVKVADAMIEALNHKK